MKRISTAIFATLALAFFLTSCNTGSKPSVKAYGPGKDTTITIQTTPIDTVTKYYTDCSGVRKSYSTYRPGESYGTALSLRLEGEPLDSAATTHIISETMPEFSWDMPEWLKDVFWFTLWLLVLAFVTAIVLLVLKWLAGLFVSAWKNLTRREEGDRRYAPESKVISENDQTRIPEQAFLPVGGGRFKTRKILIEETYK